MSGIIEKVTRRVRLREAPGPNEAGDQIAIEAIIRGEVVGRVIASRHKSTVTIDELDVRPDARCRGIGRRLVKAILAKSQLLSIDKATVSTRGNEGFWALQGFRPIDHPDKYPERVMTKAVGPVAPSNPFR